MPDRRVKGRLLEYSVRKKLRSLGYTVFRCAGSRPVDLIAIRKSRILLVACNLDRRGSNVPTIRCYRIQRLS